MVLEAIISPKTSRKNPWIIAILAFVFVTIGVLASDYLGIEKSIMAITLTAIPAVPFLWRLFDFEEEETEQSIVLGSRTIARHLPIILVMSMFFIGLIGGFVFWNIALPSDKAEQLFEVQLNELRNIGAVSGKAISTNEPNEAANFNEPLSGRAVFPIDNNRFTSTFEMLFFHNLGVLLIILLFSLLYGAGAVLVFVWNASIIGTFIATYAKNAAAGVGVSLISSVGVSALSLVPHGSFELLAYLIAALGGGILSSAITREAHKTNSFMLVMHDCLKLTAVAIIFLAIGAFIEAGAIVG